jgi:hypothetical protein
VFAIIKDNDPRGGRGGSVDPDAASALASEGQTSTFLKMLQGRRGQRRGTNSAFKEPVHADRGLATGGESDRSTERDRLPQKRTPTEPRNLQQFRQFGEVMVREGTATFWRKERARPSIANGVDRAAGTDNFRDSFCSG